MSWLLTITQETAMASQTILVANDDQTYVSTVQELLASVGYPHVMAHAGGGAFQRIRDEQPDLVVLDINLVNPGRGWQILDLLKLHPKTTHIPVILCATDPR